MYPTFNKKLKYLYAININIIQAVKFNSKSVYV